MGRRDGGRKQTNWQTERGRETSETNEAIEKNRQEKTQRQEVESKTRHMRINLPKQKQNNKAKTQKPWQHIAYIYSDECGLGLSLREASRNPLTKTLVHTPPMLFSWLSAAGALGFYNCTLSRINTFLLTGRESDYTFEIQTWVFVKCWRVGCYRF